MSAPRATMRLQFHRGFTFADAAALVPYFAALGVSHLYASPITTARPGSMHGYDVVDPQRVNPELGGEDALRRLVAELRRQQMGLIVDIVPNHMAIGSANAWWMDVLARGEASRHAKFFDIDWHPPSATLRGKVLLPILGRPYGEALDAGEIRLDRQAGQPAVIRYFDHSFPLAVGTLQHDDATLAACDPASPDGRQRLHALLEAQHYRLAWWRSANDEINYRRFFDINELAALRVEDEEVFEAVHATLFRLYAEGLLDGVRVDHVDGLAQPERYCRALRHRLQGLEKQRPAGVPAGPAYFVVEKILAHAESLVQSWQTDGTTGYDFMDQVSALLHDANGEPVLRELWERVSGRAGDFAEEEDLARRQTLQRSFTAQLEANVQILQEIAQGGLATRDFSRSAIRRCLSEILAHFPVYRIYARLDHHSQADLRFLAQALARARVTCLPSDRWLVDILGGWLAGTRIRPDADAKQAVALTRFQQLSAPLCAKAVEDTAFYRYGRLISRNDVGFDARLFASSTADFHRRMQARAANFPHSMLATATHDHKRGEDVRARLAVLSELAEVWASAVQQWLPLSAAFCSGADETRMPSVGDRAISFQTIVGAWPLGLAATDYVSLAAYAKRIAAWQQKALREAKLQSDWSAPNETYENAARDFVTRLFSEPSELLTGIAEFAQRVAPAGAVNALAQALVKVTAPGVPDIYQGTEYWDLSLVDPDNRAPVDFAARQNSLAHTVSPPELLAHWADGHIKQFLIARSFALRKEKPALFGEGSYLPLQTAGPLADHVVAFARVLRNSTAITVFCRSIAHLLASDSTLAIPSARWRDTRIVIPADLGGRYSQVLWTQQPVTLEAEVGIERLFDRLPLALLTN